MAKKLEGAGLRGQVAGQTSFQQLERRSWINLQRIRNRRFS